MNTTQTKPVYTCRPPSLAHSVISFFVKNPDEVMTAEDIVTKWDAKPGSLSGLLLQAKKSGAITHNGGLYMLGDMATAKLCIDPDAAPDLPAPPVSAPTPAPAPAPAPAPIQAKAPLPAPSRGTNATSLVVPGIGSLTVTYERMASKLPVSGHKWDPLLNMLAAAPQSEAEGKLATVRLPRAMTGAIKAGIESWHKRHKDIPSPCRFRASVAGDQVLVQRVAIIERTA